MKQFKKLTLTLALLITAATGAWAADTYTITFSGFGNEACNKTVTDATLEYSETFFVNDVDADYIALNDVGGSNEYVSISQAETQITITVKSAFEGTVNVTVYYVNGDGDESQRNISVTCVKSGPAVTIADGNGEASFKMPQYDVTASYTLKRDMSVDMAVTVQDAEQNSRFRVQNQGNSFVPVGLTNEQVMALFNVHDDIESKDLTAITDYTVQIFAADDDGNATGEAMTFATFTYAPGNYVAKAVAASNSNYSGETALSNVFTLFQGYEVTVGAGEYATFYKDENLYTEDVDAELYTIASVTDNEAVLSDVIETAPSYTPLLVYNKSEQAKTILLIPTTEQADAVTAADQFQGTLDAVQMPASTEGRDYYVCTGNAFVWVKSAGTIAANRCWLEIIAQPAGVRANTRSIVSGGDTTNIDATTRDALEGDYYDLQGRKVEKPLRKGIYIKSGKKVIKH